MNMAVLKRFLEDFKYNLEFEYYVKLSIVYSNYQMVDLKKKSYQQFKKLKKEIHNNGDFETYRDTLSNLEKELLLETDITSYKIIQQKIANYPEILFWFPLTQCQRQEEISKYNETSKINRLIKNFKNTNSNAKFIGIHKLINIILPAIPTPKNVGINSDFWNPESFESFIIRYFKLPQTRNSFLHLDTIEKEWLNYHGINYNNNASILNFFATQYHSILQLVL